MLSSEYMKKSDEARIITMICPSWGVHYPPLGTAILSALLKGKWPEIPLSSMDLNIKAYDLAPDKSLWHRDNFHIWRDGSYGSWLEKLMEKWADEIANLKPSIVFFTLYDSNAFFSKKIAQLIKKRSPSIFFIAGGPHITKNWPQYAEIQDPFDLSIAGRAEEFIAALPAKDAPNIREIRKMPRDFRSPDHSEYPDSFNPFPYPDFSFYPLEKYTQKGSLPIYFSLGCTNKCTFCGERKLHRKYRQKSLSALESEIEYLKENYDFSHLVFTDSMINPSPLIFEKIVKIMGRSGLSWSAQISGAMDFSRNFAERLANSNCIMLSFGAESGSTAILKKMKKNIRPHQAIKTARSLSERGIETAVYYIVGYPNEGILDYLKTLLLVWKMSKFIGPDKAYFYPCQLYSGHPAHPFSTGNQWRSGLNCERERRFKIALLKVIHSLANCGCRPKKAELAIELIMKGRVKRQEKNYGTSIKYFEKAAKIAPFWFLPYREIGWTKQLEGDFIGAKRAYKMALFRKASDFISKKNLEVLKG